MRTEWPKTLPHFFVIHHGVADYERLFVNYDVLKICPLHGAKICIILLNDITNDHGTRSWPTVLIYSKAIYIERGWSLEQLGAAEDFDIFDFAASLERDQEDHRSSHVRGLRDRWIDQRCGFFDRGETAW